MRELTEEEWDTMQKEQKQGYRVCPKFDEEIAKNIKKKKRRYRVIVVMDRTLTSKNINHAEKFKVLSPASCMVCPYGHMLNCHFPEDCEMHQCYSSEDIYDE